MSTEINSNHFAYEDHTGLWQNELRDWMPDVIFDAHVHVGPPGIVREMSAEKRMEPLATFTHLPWDDLLFRYEQVFSGKTVEGAIAFGFPLYEIDLDAANRYIIELMKRDSRVKGFALAHPTDARWTIGQFEAARRSGVRFRGLKPYFDLTGKSNYELTMPEFVPDDLLPFAEDEELILMLHTSGLGMSDPVNQGFIRSIAESYPHIKIVLAHMGRYLDPRQFFEFLESDVLDHPTVFLEMSSAVNTRVYERVLSRPDLHGRLLFGTDFPYGLIAGVEYWAESVRPGLFLTRDDYVWSDRAVQEEFAEERTRLTYNTYHVIKAVKDAMDVLNLDRETRDRLKEGIFHGNAAALVHAGQPPEAEPVG